VFVEAGFVLNDFVGVCLCCDGVCLCVGRAFVLTVYVLCVCVCFKRIDDVMCIVWGIVWAGYCAEFC